MGLLSIRLAYVEIGQLQLRKQFNAYGVLLIGQIDLPKVQRVWITS